MRLMFHTKCDTKDKKQYFRLLIESMKSIEIEKTRLIWKKVVSIDCYRLTDTIDIDQHNFID